MAERTASVAMKLTVPSTGGLLLQRKCACGTHTSAGGECDSCARERLQRKSATKSPPGSIPSSVYRVLGSSGTSLDVRTRTTMESSFGHDFSSVRIHADSAASESARAVSALAYTVGRNVVFADGQYSPGTASGRRLIAHELAHVVQQQDIYPVPNGVSDPQSAFERQADRAADRVMSGRPVSGLSRSQASLIAREVDMRPMPAKDGGTDNVTRIVTPGKCALGPQSRANTSGDITASNAFLQLDLCRGGLEGQVRGEVDYGDALKKAGQAVGKLVSSAASGKDAQQATSTFGNDLKQLKPGAAVKVNFQAGDVFRLDLVGTGDASVSGGVAGKATGRATFDIGPVKIVAEATASDGTQQQPDYGVTFNVQVGGGGLKAPDCRVCQCSDPKVDFVCAHVPPKPDDKPPGKTPQAPQPRYIPYFFNRAKTTPNRQRQAISESGLNDAVNLIRRGYTIARIEGNASPEGPLEGRRGTFANNTELANARAIRGKKLLDARIRETLGAPIWIMRTDSLRRALLADYPVVGRAELFGSSRKDADVDDRALMSHLQGVLASPDEGEPDPLVREHVTGAGLAADVQGENLADVEAFRTGKRGNRKLTRKQRLRAIYEPLRRALIVLAPPPVPSLDLRPSQKQIENVIGKPVDCSDANKALFANVPIDKPFEGECRMPGKGSSR